MENTVVLPTCVKRTGEEESSGITLQETAIESVMDGYGHLQLFPEVLEGLHLLREARCPLVILSNGSLSMLRDVAENSGIAPYFDAILSADTVQVFKPAPQVYQGSKLLQTAAGADLDGLL